MATFNPKDSREGYLSKLIYGGRTYYYTYTTSDPAEIRSAHSTAFGYGLWSRTYFGFNTSSLAGAPIASATLKLYMYHDGSTATSSLYLYVGQGILHDPLNAADWNAYVGMTQFETLATSTLSTDSANPTLVQKSVPVAQVNTSGWTDFCLRNPRGDTVTTYTFLDKMYTTNNSDSSLWPVLEVVTASGERRIFHAVHQ